jgi:hypothetical protein
VFSGVAWPDMVGRGCYKTFSYVSSGISWPVGGWGCYNAFLLSSNSFLMIFIMLLFEDSASPFP